LEDELTIKQKTGCHISILPPTWVVISEDELTIKLKTGRHIWILPATWVVTSEDELILIAEYEDPTLLIPKSPTGYGLGAV
jgi:hypothetical protein